MKKIEAVIPSARLDTIRAELERRGVCGSLTVTQVRHGDTHQSSDCAGNSDDSLKEKIKVELIVPDRQIDKVVNVLLRHSSTDCFDRDGHVTLLSVDEILQNFTPIQVPTPTEQSGHG
jgi:nitrogen regulatory protein PII